MCGACVGSVGMIMAIVINNSNGCRDGYGYRW